MLQMCTATLRGPQLQNFENHYRCEEPQKEEFREFDIYFLIALYTVYKDTLEHYLCVFVLY